MEKLEKIKLSALSYVQKNKRPLKSVDDFLAGYDLCLLNIKDSSAQEFKNICKFIIESLVKRKGYEFYDPNMGQGRKTELEGEISEIKKLLDLILNSDIK